MRFRYTFTAFFLTLAAARADVVLDWNTELLAAIRTANLTPGVNPPRASRQMAMLNLAMYDAINGLGGAFRPYQVLPAAPAGASKEAAACAAAKTILDALYIGTGTGNPTVLANINTRYTNLLAAIADGPAETDGITWGNAVGTAMLALRANDGAGATVAYTAPATPGNWRPTLPASAAALLPGWGAVTPFGLNHGSQFRPQPPPKLNSAAYASELNYIKEIGGTTSTTRNANQTQIAQFWADGGSTETPPGHWIHIAQTVSTAQNLTLEQNARLFSYLGMATADAAIACWEAKYAYNLWRPITAIREADTDGNDETTADAAWLPLIGTPPFPEYTSGHSTFSRSAATILAWYFGNDDIPFATTSDGLSGVTRNYTSFSAAADEAGVSRVYGGIHFMSGNVSAQACGYAVASFIADHYLAPAKQLQFAVIVVNPGGAALSLSVTPNKSYRIEASSDLSTWQQIATVTSNTDTANFTDTSATPGKRFYRAIGL